MIEIISIVLSAFGVMLLLYSLISLLEGLMSHRISSKNSLNKVKEEKPLKDKLVNSSLTYIDEPKTSTSELSSLETLIDDGSQHSGKKKQARKRNRGSIFAFLDMDKNVLLVSVSLITLMIAQMIVSLSNNSGALFNYTIYINAVGILSIIVFSLKRSLFKFSELMSAFSAFIIALTIFIVNSVFL